MYGIYQYKNGLHFTGIITTTEEKAIEYISNLCGSWQEKPAKDWTPTNRKYEKIFVPYYNKNAFTIKKVKVI